MSILQTAPHGGRILTWSELVATVAPKFFKPFAKATDQLEPIALLTPDPSGNVHIQGDLVLDCTTQNVVVEGNLIVDGNIIMYVDEGFGTFLVVTGNVTANAICLDGFPELLVRGDVTCRNGIVGIHGDDGGYFEVQGRVHAPILVADTYFNMVLNGPVEAATVNTSYRQMKADYDLRNVHRALLSQFVINNAGDADETDDDERDNSLNGEAVVAALKAGQPVLRTPKA